MTAATATENNFKQIPRDFIRPSKTNPRKHFDQTYIEQLAASIADKGIVEPLVVRHAKKKGDGYEIVVGECRYRAAGIAKLADLPCIVQDLTDEQAMEIQIIENLHRKDLTPLEEAAGFRALVKSNPDKHSAATIGTRVGKSARWVWDIMKLADLIPEAKQLLDQGIISVNHAIPISRLTELQQAKVIHPQRGGLFTHDNAFDFSTRSDKTDPYSSVKPVTVRELNKWIAQNIRFDVDAAAKAAPFQFEEMAEEIAKATEQPGRGKKVVPITRETYVRPEAKDPTGARTYGPQSWRRADGTKGTTPYGYPTKWKDSPECEHSILGTVVTGPGQGETFKVCIARDKCTVHWGTEIREKARRAKQNTKTKSTPAKKSSWEIDNERREAAREKAQERWKTFGPALRKATEEKLQALTANVPKHIFQKLLKDLGLPKATQPADVVRALVIQKVANTFRNSNGSYYPGEYWEKQMVEWANAIGVNVAALEPKKEEPAKAATKKPAAKKRAAKKR